MASLEHLRSPLTVLRGAVFAHDLVLLATLAILSGGVGLFWGLSVPFNGGPDEASHFHVMRFIHENGRLPVFDPTELWLYRTEVGVVESYATFPPLAYALGAGLLAIVDSTFWGARFLSLIGYVGSVLLTFAAARRLFPQSRAVAISAALVLACIPQVAFTASYANNDALALMESAALFYLLIVIADRPHPLVFGIAGLVVGALLLTKYTLYAPAAAGLLAFFWLARRSRSPWACRLCLMTAVLFTSGWWFVRNWQLYGEIIPGQVVAAAKGAAGGNSLFIAAAHGINLFTLSFATEFWSLTLQSLVGVFGFQTVALPPVLYVGTLLAAVIGVAGCVRLLATGPMDPRTKDAALFGAALVLATVASAMAINIYGEWSAQGRYLFPALVPVVLLLVAGWHAWGATHRRLRWMPWAPVVGMVGLNIVSLVGWAVPAYFGPLPQHIIVQVDSPGDEQPSSGQLRISGWAMLEAASSWGPFSPAAVIEYRKPVDRVLVWLDGRPGIRITLGEARYGVRRSDVGDYYGRLRRLNQVGFELVLPPGTVEPGLHTLVVCASSVAESETGCTQRSLRVL